MHSTVLLITAAIVVLKLVDAVNAYTTITQEEQQQQQHHQNKQQQQQQQQQQQRILQTTTTTTTVSCNVCPSGFILTNSSVIIPEGTLSFQRTGTNTSCFRLEIEAQSNFLTANECNEISTSIVPKLCGCSNDTTTGITVPSPESVPVPVPITTPVAVPVPVPITTPVAIPVQQPQPQASVPTNSDNSTSPSVATVPVSSPSSVELTPNTFGVVTIQLQFVPATMTPYISTKYDEIITLFFTKYLPPSSASGGDDEQKQISNVIATTTTETIAVSSSRRRDLTNKFEYDNRQLQSSSSTNNNNTTTTLFPLDTIVSVSYYSTTTTTSSLLSINTTLREIVTTNEQELVTMLKSGVGTTVPFYFTNLNSIVARETGTPSGPIPPIPNLSSTAATTTTITGTTVIVVTMTIIMVGL